MSESCGGGVLLLLLIVATLYITGYLEELKILITQQVPRLLKIEGTKDN